jgi:hypothetical protein
MSGRALPLGLLLSMALLAACGGGSSPSETGFAASASGVSVTGTVSQKGTKGSIVVFAFADLGPNDDPVNHEAVSVAPLSPDGDFDLGVVAAPNLTLVFLADASNDGAVDQGDPIARLSAPELADLQAGDRVHISNASIDFHGHRVSAALEVARANEPARTPTPAP